VCLTIGQRLVSIDDPVYILKYIRALKFRDGVKIRLSKKFNQYNDCSAIAPPASFPVSWALRWELATIEIAMVVSIISQIRDGHFNYFEMSIERRLAYEHCR
jgi:hypothetical protein